MNIREKLLAEYRSENFDPKSKIQHSDDGQKAFYTFAEKIKFFNADYPNGTIKTEIVIDNNIFATVRAIVVCEGGTREAFGKWFHSNNDVFGMNYVGTAQTVAISKALTLLGYGAESEDNTEPDGAMNIAPESSAPTDNDFPPQMLPFNKKDGISALNQAKSRAIYGFGGRTIGEILDKNDPDEIVVLRDKLRFELDMNTSLAPTAELILPLLS